MWPSASEVSGVAMRVTLVERREKRIVYVHAVDAERIDITVDPIKRYYGNLQGSNLLLSSLVANRSSSSVCPHLFLRLRRLL